MIQIPGYKIIEELATGTRKNAHVYRCRREKDKRNVILKISDSEYSDNWQLANFKREYDLLKGLSLNGVVRAYELFQHELRIILVLEDDGSQSLLEYLETVPHLPIESFLMIAIQLVDILGALHSERIIHRDIKPQNIIIEPDTLRVKIIDLSLASLLSEETQELVNPGTLEGTLEYISPEQTGRMNRAVDYRSDFYSLGVTLFYMLTGRVPFEATDSLELVHCHLSVVPPSVREFNPEVPEMIAKIIGKLLQKQAEERYQGSYGLKLDLKRCQKELLDTSKITSFDLGKNDIHDRLHISHKLYGRENQLAALLSSFEKAVEGSSELFLIAGYSGVGKTSLVKEIQKSIIKTHSYFITGKYEQLKRNKPYHAITTAFQDLIRQILTEPAANLEKYKKEILKAIGNTGQIIIDVIPNLEFIIGPQPPVQRLDPIETQNRFNMVFQNFAHVFMKKEHPVVMFVDDMQWIDNASVNLLQSMLTSGEFHYLLIIGSYRDNEVDLLNPLTAFMNQLNKNNIIFNNISLEPLNLNSIKLLLSDTLNCSTEETTKFAELLLDKTQGNPFFIGEFLYELYLQKLIRFSYAKKQWEWKIEEIRQQKLTNNVAELLSNKLNQLPPETQFVLKMASYMGNRFNLKMLATICQKSASTVARHLWQAFQTNLVIPVNESNKTAAITSEAAVELAEKVADKLYYRFAHDKIQKAAYDLISPDLREKLHLDIARLLISDKKLSYDDEKIFEVVDHYNASLRLLTEEHEILDVIQYNLLVAKKAKNSVAYAQAVSYLESAISIFPSNIWTLNRQMTFLCYKEYVQCLYLTGKFNEAEENYKKLFVHAENELEKASLFMIKAGAYSSLSKYKEIVKTALILLKDMGFPLPSHVGAWNILVIMLKIRLKTGNRVREHLENLKPMSNERMMAISEILYAIYPAMTITNSKYYAGLVICKMVMVSLEYGYTEGTPVAFIIYANLLISLFKAPSEALDIYQWLIKILEESSENNKEMCKYLFLLGTYLSPWFDHASVLTFLEKSYQLSIETGNLEYASYDLHTTSCQLYFGKPLSEAKQKITAMMTFLHRINNIGPYNYSVILSKALDYLDGTGGDAEDIRNEVIKRNEKNPLFILHTAMRTGYFYLLIGDYKKAFEDSRKVFEYDSMGVITIAVGYLTHGLAAAKLYSDSKSGKDKSMYWSALNMVRKKLEKLSRLSPVNFKARYLFVLAEIKRINKNYEEAIRLYDDAILDARSHNYVDLVALMNEFAAKFYVDLNRLTCAKGYIENAWQGYKFWGAVAKCKQLQQDYPEILNRFSQEYSLTKTGSASSSDPLSGSIGASQLDVMAIVKSSQAISSEIHMVVLQEKLLKILLEISGAQQGAIVIEENNKLCVIADASGDKTITVHAQGIPIEKYGNIPVSVISYVQRTRESVIIGSVSQSAEKFGQDEYLKKNNVKSFLCIPILNQSVISGQIYLENRLAEHVFTDQHINILQVLLGQISISFENAKLYESTERFVPHDFMEKLSIQKLTQARLGDHVKREMSVLFCDIRGFTPLSENFSPEETFEFINLFLGNMEPVIKQAHGFIDKFIGDAIMALFDNAEDAVMGGILILKQLEKFNKFWVARNANNKPIRIGIGINTGELMLGIIGGGGRIESSVLGDAVNIASRIEDLTKTFKKPLLIADDTYLRLPVNHPFKAEKIGEVELTGKTKKVIIWSIEEK